MTHDQIQPLLEAYFDDELDVATSLTVAEHAAGCSDCQRWLGERRALSARLRAPTLRYAPPPGLEQRLAARFGPPSVRSTRLSFWPAAIAAGLVLAISGYLLGQLQTRLTGVAGELVAAHVRAVLSTRDIDVRSSDHHTVRPWLSGQLPFSPPVPELAGGDVELVGGRVDFVNHMRVAALVYRRGHHTIDVFIWPRSAGRGRLTSESTVDGYHVATAATGEFDAAMVSDMSMVELRDFRDRWVDATR
jgi:anti-sigma factor RsiW